MNSESGVRFTVLVVCTGNACRSPMAEGILRKLFQGMPVRVESAGTYALARGPATPFAVEAAARVGVDISAHRARQLAAGLVKQADLILAMDKGHRESVLDLAPDAARKTRLLLSYAGRPGAEVDDPIGKSLDHYEHTISVMMPALEKVAAEVRERLAGG